MLNDLSAIAQRAEEGELLFSTHVGMFRSEVRTEFPARVWDIFLSHRLS